NPLNHRHNVEIAEKLETAMENVQFVPQIIPITRGMLSNSYFTVDKDIDAAAYLKEVYKNDRFVRIRKDPVELKNVVGTHFCDMYIDQKGSLVFINAAIDNLLRGASSQAMACANLICGLDEYAGLPEFAHTP
ncbi:MAG: N-acetyl-gamma-glutamyl-phosphate reductase, partial [Campylobacterota bacterium]